MTTHPRPFVRSGRSILALAIFVGSIFTGCTLRSPTMTEDGQEYDLRRLRWGMNAEQVLQAEKARLVYQDSHLLAFGTKTLGRHMSLEYHLGNDQFYRAVYRLGEDYLMELKYVRDYNDLKAILGKKYGLAVRDEMNWRKPHLEGDPSQWGVAVSIGDLSCLTTWETPRTLITLSLTGGNYQVECTIEYISRDLVHLAHAREGEAPEQSGSTDRRLKKAMDDF